MKNLKKIFGVIAVILVLALIIGCSEPPPGDEVVITDNDEESGITDTNVIATNIALRANPIPSSNGAPRVLDSFSDTTGNHYLIDVGQIRNIYVSTMAIVHYNGMTPVNFSRTTISTNTVTEAVTETISSSITKSNTQGFKTGLETSWEKRFPFVGKFSAKLSLEWNGSWTNTNTSTRATETSISETNQFAESISTSFTIGQHGEPAGWHRYALYAIADVYFIVSTCLDNQELLGWETVVAVRNNSFIPHMEFSPNGDFDNSPIGEIIFPEDFWEALDTPPSVGTPPPPPPPMPDNYFTNEVHVRNFNRHIISGSNRNRFSHPHDLINFNTFGIDLNTMKQQGYKTICFLFEWM